jgi:hypothetical protein
LSTPLKEEIRRDIIHKLLDDRNCDYEDITGYIEQILNLIEKRIDEKIQHVNEVLNDSRITIQGCQRMKGKKDAYEEVKEMLSK